MISFIPIFQYHPNMERMSLMQAMIGTDRSCHRETITESEVITLLYDEVCI
jgi:hypothetical protein